MAQLVNVKHQLNMLNEEEDFKSKVLTKKIRKKTSFTEKTYQRNESSRDQEVVWETDVLTFRTDVL